MRYDKRLEQLEYQHLLQLAAEAGRPYGLTAADLLAEARRFFALTSTAQAAELDALMPDVTPEEAQILEAQRPREGDQ